MLREDYGMPPMEARMTVFGICVAHSPGTLETYLEDATVELRTSESYYRATDDDEWESV